MTLGTWQSIVLIDPNEWSEDGTVALDGVTFSDDGKYLAYGIQDGGSDWRTWRVMEIESGRYDPNVIIPAIATPTEKNAWPIAGLS